MEKKSKDILFNIGAGVICILIGLYTINFNSNSSKIKKLEKELLKYEFTENPLELNYLRKIDFYEKKKINPFYPINPFEN